MITNDSSEFEIQILGCILKDPLHSNCREVLDSVSVSDFNDYQRGGIFKALKSMSEAKMDIDPILVDEYLISINFEYAGLIILFEMVREVVSFANLGNYAKKLKEVGKKRDLISLLNNTLSELGDHRPTEDVMTTISEGIKNLELNSNGRELMHLREVEGDWLDRLEERVNLGGTIKGLSTGIDELDEALGGLDEEGLLVVAGLPSMGKTLFVQNIASHNGINKKEDFIFFSLEMSDMQLYERFISSIGNICPKKLKAARLSNEELGRIQEAAVAIRNGKLFLTDEPKLSVGQIRAKVRRHKIKNPNLKGVAIDYLGLMKLGKADRHDLAIGNITRDLKELAKEVKVPIILIVQANRGSYGNKRPNMSNLKDSSCIEFDADVIIFIHRHEIIDPDTELKGITEIIIAKDRHGDANGTIYAEKINGGFRGLSATEVATIVYNEELRLNPKKYKKTGM